MVFDAENTFTNPTLYSVLNATISDFRLQQKCLNLNNTFKEHSRSDTRNRYNIHSVNAFLRLCTKDSNVLTWNQQIYLFNSINYAILSFLLTSFYTLYVWFYAKIKCNVRLEHILDWIVVKICVFDSTQIHWMRIFDRFN